MASIMYLTCVHLVYVILVQAQNNHLTATPNENSVYQMGLLIKDVNSCIWKHYNMNNLADSTNSIKHCFVTRKKHCIHKRRVQANEYIDIFISRNVYCTNIVLENNYDYPRKLVVNRQFLLGYVILVDFIIFDFEFDRRLGLILKYINDNNNKKTYFYHGKRNPWTIITNSDKVIITIKTMVYRKYKLHLFYSSYRRHWLSHFQFINDASFYYSLNIRTFALAEFQKEIKIERFQYTYFSLHLRKFQLSISPFNKSKTDLTLYDGPGRLANILVRLSHGSSFKTLNFKTSSFIAYLQLDMAVAGEIDNVTIVIRTIRSEYPLCNITDRKLVSVESSEHHNTICRLYSRTYKMSMNLRVNKFIFEGAKTGLSKNYRYNCQYGGIVFILIFKHSHIYQNSLLKICDSRSHFTLRSKSSVFDALVIWLKGYSRGSLLATIFPSDCVQYELELLGRPDTIKHNVRFIIDDSTSCVRYVCPPVQSSYQKHCHFSLQSKGGSLGIVKLKISQSETISTCIPEYQTEKRKPMSHLYGTLINNWPIGDKETFNLTLSLNRERVIFFKYLINGDVSLPYLCANNNRRKQMSIMFTTSACGRIHKSTYRVTFPVNSMQAFTNDCHDFVFILNSNVNELLMKEDTRSRIYEGLIVKSNYGKHCPSSCRNHTIIVHVLDKSSNRVYKYTSNVGKKINTILYHHGMHIIVHGPKYPCEWIKSCEIEVYFGVNHLDVNMQKQTTTWEYDSKFYHYYNRR